MEYVTKQIVATLFSLSMVILLAGTSQAALNCTSCHGIAAIDAHPVDTPSGSPATYRNITSGAVKGNHNTHSGPSLTGNVCAKCHGSATAPTAAYSTNHAILSNYSVRMTPGVGYNKGAGVVTSFRQTATPTLGTCATVDCHFETTTPTWGSAPLGAASLTTCGTCHEALPTSESHTVHINEHGNNLSACTYCHSDHTVAAKPFQHATSVGRPITVTSGNTYTGSNDRYLPSQAGRILGSCATASCHDDGLGNGAASLVESPLWGSTVAKCEVCHPFRPISGSHPEHVTSASIACAACHKGAVESTTVPLLHTNTVVDVYKTTVGDLGYPPAKLKGSAYTTCTTASCHVNPSSGTGVQLISPVWGDTSQVKCDFCHISRPTTGSHQAHYNAGYPLCASCHSGAVENTSLSTNHGNNLIDVTGYAAAKTIGSAPGSCSTAVCHDNGRGVNVLSPTWGTANNDCSACHANLPATGSHVQHITGVGITCGNCHKGAVQGTSASALHLNGFVDVYKTTEGDFGYPIKKPKSNSDSSYLSCTTTSCHGTLSPVWGANTPNYQCTKCHGKGTLFANYSSVTDQQAAPGYEVTGVGVGRQTGVVTSNVSDDPKVGAHDTHMRALNNLGKPAACTDCHVVPSTAFASGHMNGSSLPTWSNLVQNKETVLGSAKPYTFAQGVKIPLYDGGTGTCSVTYCHGSTLTGGANTSPKWNETGYLTGVRANDCSKCHGYPPTASPRYAHDPGLIDCSGCHPHDGARESTDPLLGKDYHINGLLEASAYCNACHDYDTRGANGSIWGKNQMGVEAVGAHAMHINYLKGRMNVTAMDANFDGFGSANFNGICGVCHSKLPANHQQGNSTSSLRNINFGDNSVDRQFGPSLPIYNGTTYVSSGTAAKTCSNTDCHYKTSPIWQPY
jgi:predicted CxxxxCH...CXXCH cytochrome family protein